jgi:uncharacterized membrane protein
MRLAILLAGILLLLGLWAAFVNWLVCRLWPPERRHRVRLGEQAESRRAKSFWDYQI